MMLQVHAENDAVAPLLGRVKHDRLGLIDSMLYTAQKQRLRIRKLKREIAEKKASAVGK